MERGLNKKVRRLLILFLSIALTLSFSFSAAAKEKPKKANSYRTIIEIEDWGAVITKVIVDLGKPVPAYSVTKETFKVHVVRNDPRLANPILDEGDRTVTKAFVSDKDGNPVKKGSGKYAVLEMKIAPDDSLGSALNYDWQKTGFNNWVDYQYTITQVKDIVTHFGTLSGLVINKLAGETRELVDKFSTGKGTYDNIPLTYANFTPKKDKGKNPLIIWLHGAGEGGTDPTIPLSANKADTFASAETQDHFGGAYVLVPQTPTYWMNGFGGFADGTSIYEDALMSLIHDYVANHPDVDTNRIYVGGDSNGGYMTMLLIRDYPGYFAAAFPVCEGLHDNIISDTDLHNIMKTPTWFVAAKTDTTLPPMENAAPTYNRLVEAGDKNVHLSLFDDVHDMTGLYKNADGTPYEYYGHWSWIYVYNNIPTDTINGKGTTIMDWLATQSLN
jgi:predicted peptidase